MDNFTCETTLSCIFQTHSGNTVMQQKFGNEGLEGHIKHLIILLKVEEKKLTPTTHFFIILDCTVILCDVYL